MKVQYKSQNKINSQLILCTQHGIAYLSIDSWGIKVDTYCVYNNNK